MNAAQDNQFERLFADVADRPQVAGKDGDVARLGNLLRTDPAAREAWIDHCLTEAMLHSDAELATMIQKDFGPDNVVPLPGTRLRTLLPYPDSDGVQTDGKDDRRGGRKWIAFAIAAMLVGMAIIAAGGLRRIAERNPIAGSGGGPKDSAIAPMIAPAIDRPAEEKISSKSDRSDGSLTSDPNTNVKPDSESSRQAQYEKMLLAEVKPGSLSRPPTPFVSVTTTAANPAQRVSFNRDIRPILSDNCLECHGPDAASREADLRLDREQDAVTEISAFQAGESEAPIVRGHPELSELIARIVSDDIDDRMPPLDSHKTLTVQQIELLKRWVSEGAEWEQHWAFVLPAAAVTEIPNSAPGVEIDRLVAEGLQASNLRPAQEADRRTLVRRVTLDLTGLPPTVEEVETFVADKLATDVAFEKVVDRLLDSPAYGEHRARYWLDAARYADTHGLHLDNYREMWPYRDWVIAAYNRNLPFDQFTVEQLAGDLLENPTQEQLVATGFNRCNVTTSEGGAIAEEFAVRYAIDRVATTATVWLGLTAGCAQCHDHKYDPISMREYYQMFAYFNNTTQQAMDKNAPDTPPVIRVYPTEQDQVLEKELRARAQSIDGNLKAARATAEPDFQVWLAALDPAKPPLVENAAPAGLVALSGFAAIEGKPFTLVVRVEVPKDRQGMVALAEQIDSQGRGLRLSLDIDNRGLELAYFGKGGEFGDGGALKVKQIHSMNAGSKLLVSVISDGSRDPKGTTVYVGEQEMTRDRYPYLEHDDLHDSFSVAEGTRFERMESAPVLEELRVFDRSLTLDEIKLLNQSGKVLAAANKAAAVRSKEDTELLRSHFLVTACDPYRAALKERSEVQLAISTFENRVPVTHVMQENEADAMAHMLERGEYDRQLEEVEPGVPAALPPLPVDAPANRLGLARWLVDVEHPLTARVTVNRLWQQLFGLGLVKTSDDFGSQGESPSHPQLLDWLALDFVQNGWDVKRTMKQMVMSATYRQSSRITPESYLVDPQNRMLARGPRFRLDAEVIRDQALAASGLLATEIGGPGVRPYQPDGLWSAVGYTNSNTVKFARDHGDRLYRRSVYTFWKRTAPPANMTAFDAPNRESCTVRRERTNTPLQALVLMNDTQFVEAARHLAELGLKSGTGEQALDEMSRRLLGRPLDSAEKAVVSDSLQVFRETYRTDPSAASALLHHGDRPNDPAHDPAELAALTMVANQLLNLDETISKN